MSFLFYSVLYPRTTPSNVRLVTGFEIPDRFVVGYAFDYNDHFRDMQVSSGLFFACCRYFAVWSGRMWRKCDLGRRVRRGNKRNLNFTILPMTIILFNYYDLINGSPIYFFENCKWIHLDIDAIEPTKTSLYTFVCFESPFFSKFNLYCVERLYPRYVRHLFVVPADESCKLVAKSFFGCHYLLIPFVPFFISRLSILEHASTHHVARFIDIVLFLRPTDWRYTCALAPCSHVFSQVTMTWTLPFSRLFVARTNQSRPWRFIYLFSIYLVVLGDLNENELRISTYSQSSLFILV